MKKVIDIRGREICSLEDFLKTYSSECAAERAAKVLYDYGIFPLTYCNPKLKVLNGLGLYTYLSGSLSCSQNSQYSGRIVQNNTRGFSKVFMRELGLTLTRSEKHRHLCFFGDNGAVYARLLVQMGFHLSRGTKASSGSSLPKYLCDIIGDWDNLHCDSRKVCRKYMRDLVNVWFDAKASMYPPTLVLRLLAQPDKSLVLSQGNRLIRAINIAFPGVNYDGAVQISRNEDKFSGVIQFTRDHVAGFAEHGSYSPVGFEIKLSSPNFSFEHTR